VGKTSFVHQDNFTHKCFENCYRDHKILIMVNMLRFTKGATGSLNIQNQLSTLSLIGLQEAMVANVKDRYDLQLHQVSMVFLLSIAT
jgi:hypothetical protein